MAIVDRFGNPIEQSVLSEPQTSKIAGLYREWAGHPSRGITPAKLARILQEAELGNIIQQSEFFSDMEEKDGHLQAEMFKRRQALLTVDWSIEPPEGASAQEKSGAAFLTEIYKEIPDFEDVIFDSLSAVGNGFACQEIEWQLQQKVWVPKKIEFHEQREFTLDPQTRSQIRWRAPGVANGEPLLPFGWIEHRHKAKSGYIARAGLYRVLAWPYLYKNYAVRDLAEFLEIYGLPLRLGRYPSGANNAEKNTLLQAVIGIGHDAAGIIPLGMEIEFIEAAKGTEAPFAYMIEMCDQTISKATLGVSVNSQASAKSFGSGSGPSQMDNDLRHDLRRSDARQVSGTYKHQLSYPLLALNRGATPSTRLPELVFHVKDPADLGAEATVLKTLAEVGMPIPISYINQRFGIPVAKAGETLLAPPAATRPRGAGGETEAAPPAPAGKAAALRAQTAAADAAEPDAIDQLIGQALATWQPQMTALVAPIRDEIAAIAGAGGTLEDLRASLATRLKDMPIEDLATALAQADFVTRLAGEAGLDA
jgi:phage gp29-like protein